MVELTKNSSAWSSRGARSDRSRELLPFRFVAPSLSLWDCATFGYWILHDLHGSRLLVQIECTSLFLPILKPLSNSEKKNLENHTLLGVFLSRMGDR